MTGLPPLDPESRTKTILIDLDGTVCDTRHRDRLINRSGDTDWLAYSMECAGDRPIPGVVRLVNWIAGLKVILTGRHEEARRLTERWLARNGVGYDELIMRPIGDRRENVALKVAEVRKLRRRGFDPILAIDDYPKVAEAFASLQIPTLLVARNGVGTFNHKPFNQPPAKETASE